MSQPARGARRHKKVYRGVLPYLWGEWIRPIGEAIIIALIVTTFLFTTVGIQGSSDVPTVMDGERVFVPKYETWLHRLGVGSFQHGDLVVLKPPVGAPQSERPVPVLGNFLPSLTYRPFFIKRIVGVPGDRVSLRKGILYVNGEKLNEDHTIPYWKSQDTYGNANAWDNWSNLATTSEWPYDSWPEKLRPQLKNGKGPEEMTVPEGHFFVIGDNRSVGGSEDSRVFGPIKAEEIAGRATFVWWPPVRRAEDGSIQLNWRTLPRPDAFDTLN